MASIEHQKVLSHSTDENRTKTTKGEKRPELASKLINLNMRPNLFGLDVIKLKLP